MKVTELTRKILNYRREEKNMRLKGYEKITCTFGIGKLWKLDRGCRKNHIITEAIIGADGKSIYVKTNIK